MTDAWSFTPRQSIERAARSEGVDALVARCVAMLAEGRRDEDLLVVLAGPGGASVIRGENGGVDGYWPRVWAMRGLLYVWNETATTVVVNAVDDPSWRVREMSAKVTARHLVDEALESMQRLCDDDVARVQAAAQRALIRLVSAGT